LDTLYEVMKFLHILPVIFMSAPLYNLIVVSERVRFGKASVQVDRYLENVLRGNSTRCYIYQLTALFTGVFLVALHGDPLSSIFTNQVILSKWILLGALMSMLSVVHFNLQPKIDELLFQVHGDNIPEDIVAKLLPLRTLRKKMAAVCLFLVILTVILAVQVYTLVDLRLSLLLIALAALFSWRVYKKGAPRGWV